LLSDQLSRTRVSSATLEIVYSAACRALTRPLQEIVRVAVEYDLDHGHLVSGAAASGSRSTLWSRSRDDPVDVVPLSIAA
jgi:hypothetical protein